MCPTLVHTQYHPLKECRAKFSKNMKGNSKNLQWRVETRVSSRIKRFIGIFKTIAFQSTRFPMESNFQPLILDLNATPSNNISTILLSNFLHCFFPKAKNIWKIPVSRFYRLYSDICRRERRMHLILRKRFKEIWSDLAYPRTIIILLSNSSQKLRSIEFNIR